MHVKAWYFEADTHLLIKITQYDNHFKKENNIAIFNKLFNFCDNRHNIKKIIARCVSNQTEK